MLAMNSLTLSGKFTTAVRKYNPAWVVALGRPKQEEFQASKTYWRTSLIPALQRQGGSLPVRDSPTLLYSASSGSARTTECKNV